MIRLLIFTNIQILLAINIIENNTEGKDYKMQLQNVDQLQGFGFWSQCVPQLKINLITNKQFLFISSNQFLTLISQVDFDYNNFLVSHHFQLSEIDKIQELAFSFKPSEYEGQWLFNVVVFDQSRNQIYIQVSEQETKSFYMYSQFTFLNITQGGYNIQDNQIVDYFKGRLSLLEIENELKFSFNFYSQFAIYAGSLSFNNNSSFQYIVQDLVNYVKQQIYLSLAIIALSKKLKYLCNTFWIRTFWIRILQSILCCPYGKQMRIGSCQTSKLIHFNKLLKLLIIFCAQLRMYIKLKANQIMKFENHTQKRIDQKILWDEEIVLMKNNPTIFLIQSYELSQNCFFRNINC